MQFILLIAVVATYCSAQAPGDGDSRCTGVSDAPTYPDNEKTLMDSYHYLQLLPGNGSGDTPVAGAAWNDRSVDGNDEINTINPTYVSACASTPSIVHFILIFVHCSGSKVLEEYVGFRFEFVDGKGMEQLRTTGSSLSTLTRTSIIVFIIMQ